MEETYLTENEARLIDSLNENGMLDQLIEAKYFVDNRNGNKDNEDRMKVPMSRESVRRTLRGMVDSGLATKKMGAYKLETEKIDEALAYTEKLHGASLDGDLSKFPARRGTRQGTPDKEYLRLVARHARDEPKGVFVKRDFLTDQPKDGDYVSQNKLSEVMANMSKVDDGIIDYGRGRYLITTERLDELDTVIDEEVRAEDEIEDDGTSIESDGSGNGDFSLTELSGVGDTVADDLKESGFDSVEKVSKANPDALNEAVDMGLFNGVQVIKSARELLGKQD